MYKALSPGAIGVSAGSLQEGIAAAQKGGFQGVEFSPQQVADLIDAQGAEAVRVLFADANIKAAGCTLPVNWGGDESGWRQGLEELPRLAKAAATIGGTRVNMWILPFSDTLPYEENYRFHVERFTPIAKILADNGCSLGLEFIGPKTLREGKAHQFIYKMEDMLALGRDIGPNVGLLLDCWHWYTSGGTLDDLRKLTPDQVVYVHVNDAPAGVEVDQQVDNVRCLPGETGVIDIAGFLQALQSIGYDGPVTPEPFKKELKDLPSDEARLQKVGKAMDVIFAQANLS